MLTRISRTLACAVLILVGGTLGWTQESDPDSPPKTQNQRRPSMAGPDQEDNLLEEHAKPKKPLIALELDPGETPKATLDEQLERLRLGLERSSENLGSVTRLEEIINGVELWVPEVYIVTHPREDAYSLFSISDWMAEDATCQERLKGAKATPLEARSPRYGRYYVSALRIDTVAGETVALLLGWTKGSRSVASLHI